MQSFFYIIVPPLEIFRGAALSLAGSIASKCVEPHELGKTLGTLGRYVI